ncbi:MAG: dual specificity protein phosphatase family protein [Patescibacteria group bacterium]|nr:dual specificity protein phosphatase family protein [Patescibacteria group bacterium]MDE2438089.1 dual specificity protein phosphatase family protein [Patescibacteria group bacterium]
MDISKVAEHLYVGVQPRGSDYDILIDLHVKLLIDMRAFHPPHADPEGRDIEMVWFRTYDSFLTPIPVSVLHEGAAKALPFLEEEKSVFVHCKGGRHRSVAMACAILIAQGYSAKEAMGLVAYARRAADPYIWYIKRQIQQFERQWKERPVS